MPSVGPLTRTLKSEIERIPGRGLDVVHFDISPEDIWRLWIEGELYPRIEFDPYNSQVRTGPGTVPTTPLAASSGSLTISALPANQQGSGLVLAATYGEAITVGAPVYIAADGTVKNAAAAAGTKYPAVYLALATAAAGVHNVLVMGTYRDDAFTFAAGPVYLGVGAGTLTQVQPSATDQAIQLVGTATAANVLLFRPDNAWITHV